MVEKRAVWVVVPAAGLGERMGAGVNKVHLELGGMSLLQRCLRIFQNLPEVDLILPVCRSAELGELGARLKGWDLSKVLPPVAGGETRRDSVMAGLEAFAARRPGREEPLVLIHDAARCLVEEAVIRRCIAGALRAGACVAGVPVKDTVKRVGAGDAILETPPREALRQIQTPQAFRFDRLLAAYRAACLADLPVTDDASVMEAAGARVFVVEGSYRNIKLTTAEDLAVAESYLRAEEET